MKARLLHLPLLFVLLFGISGSLVFGQSPASVTWNMFGADSLSPTTTVGNIDGLTVTHGDTLAIKDMTGGAPNSPITGVTKAMRWYPYINGSAVSWGNETGPNQNRWIQFTVSPKSGNAFVADSISIWLGASGTTNHIRATLYYSTDPTFATRTLLDPDTNVTPYRDSLKHYAYHVNVLVNEGQSLYFRAYPWYDGSSSTSKYINTQYAQIFGNTVSPKISIKDARGMTDSTVTVTGVVISPNYQTTGRSYYIWDGTGGLATYIYGLSSPALKLGDSVAVIGKISPFNGLIEINPPDASSIFVIDSNATVPKPEVITVSQFNADPESYESHLIAFVNLSKLSGTWPASKKNATIYLTDDGGKDTLTVFLDSDMGLYNNPEPNWPADVIGIGSQYSSSGVGGYQFLPRYTSDFMNAGSLIGPKLISIADARSMTKDTVKITGVVISPNYQTTGRSYYIWDGTGGIATYIYGLTSPALKLGDSVIVVGEITPFNGLVEIDPLDDSSILVIDSNATVPKPEIITVNQFNTNAENYESHLIAFGNLSKLSGTWPTSKKNATIYLTDDNGKDTLTVFLDSDMGLYNIPEPTWPADVIGIGSQYSSSGVGGYQFLPRYASDFMPAGTLPVELESFKADVMQMSVVLHWETATELNNSGFEVERSMDGKTFSSIAFVKGKGTSSEKTFYSFTDNNITTGSYYYRLKQIDFDGSAKYSNIIQASITSAPAKFSLDQNYPNPFNPATMISFTVEKTGITTLTVFNTLGQKVETLFNGQAAAGQVYKVNFNAMHLSSGIYFYQLREGNNIITHKMMLMK